MRPRVLRPLRSAHLGRTMPGESRAHGRLGCTVSNLPVASNGMSIPIASC